MYITTFRVRGRGRFPFDMLRYDQCWPHTPSDIDMLHETHERDIVLAKVHSRADNGQPTYDRWRSFGWAAFHGISAKV